VCKGFAPSLAEPATRIVRRPSRFRTEENFQQFSNTWALARSILIHVKSRYDDRRPFSGDQRFFLAFAQIWRNKMPPEGLRRSILTNGHAPAAYRADTVRSIDA
jgi:predicted metalloendopeptidase